MKIQDQSKQTTFIVTLNKYKGTVIYEYIRNKYIRKEYTYTSIYIDKYIRKGI